MSLFRFHTPKKQNIIEINWPQGKRSSGTPTTVRLIGKDDGGQLRALATIGSFTYDKRAAEAGYRFEHPDVGEIEIKWKTRLLLIPEVQVYVNGEKMHGSEVRNKWGTEQGHIT